MDVQSVQESWCCCVWSWEFHRSKERRPGIRDENKHPNKTERAFISDSSQAGPGPESDPRFISRLVFEQTSVRLDRPPPLTRAHGNGETAKQAGVRSQCGAAAQNRAPKASFLSCSHFALPVNKDSSGMRNRLASTLVSGK